MYIRLSFYLCSPSGLCATLAAIANARDVISIYLSGQACRWDKEHDGLAERELILRFWRTELGGKLACCPQ